MEPKSNFERGPEYISLNDNTEELNKKPESVRNKRKWPYSENVNATCFPWITPGTKYSPITIIALHEEIENFYEYIRPTRLEHQMRIDVIKRIKNAVTSIWPQAEIKVFGSFQTSLYLPSSDIDLVILGKWKALPLWTLRDILINHNIATEDNVRVLDRATVPIVKMTDTKTDVKVDISFNMKNGMESAMFINKMKAEFPNLSKLVMVLKQFLLQRDLNEVYTGGISSYSLTLLVISFLQLYPRVDIAASNANLGVLLLEFFEFYGRHFNYSKTAISVKNGGCYFPKSLFRSFALEYRPSILCIEDPLQLGNDIGRNSYGVMNVKRAFEHAYILLADKIHPKNAKAVHGKSILGNIIRIKEEIIMYRKRIHETLQFSDLETEDELEWLKSPPLSNKRKNPMDGINLSSPISLRTSDVSRWGLQMNNGAEMNIFGGSKRPRSESYFNRGQDVTYLNRSFQF